MVSAEEKQAFREKQRKEWLKNNLNMTKEEYLQKNAFPDQKKVLKVYLEAKSVLRQLELPFIVVGGTLLGIIRDEKFLDNDLDLAVFEEYSTPETIRKIIKLFTEHGFVQSLIQRDKRLEGKTSVIPFSKDNVAVDICFLHAHNGKRFKCIMSGYKCYPELFDKKFFVKPEKILFMGVGFPVPSSPEAFLEATYGKDWRTPVGFWEWFWVPESQEKKFNQYAAYQPNLIDEIVRERLIIKLGKEGKLHHGKVCLVTEYDETKYIDKWRKALDRDDVQHKYSFSVSFIELSPRTKKAYPEDHSYWTPLREADFVFVYCSRFCKWWKWYMLPVRAKTFMKPEAKMACQFDQDFVWLFHPTWTHWRDSVVGYNEGESPKEFFERTGILEVADVYFSVLSNPPFKPYTSKPVIYFPLPHLNEEGYLHRGFKTSPVISTSNYSINDEKSRNIALLNHSSHASSIEHTIRNVVDKLKEKLPVFVFNTNIIRRGEEEIYQRERTKHNLPVGSVFFRRIIDSEEYLHYLHECYIGIEDTENYIGWSRFVLECALNYVPCIGSSESVKHLFPELYTKHKDYKEQLKIIERLYSSRKFWRKMARRGNERAMKYLNVERLVKKLLMVAKHVNAPEPKEIRVLIGTPFCNEEHSIPLYIKSLLNIDYPKRLIDVIWVENNSMDDTWKILQKYYPKVKKAGYRSVTLLQSAGEKLSVRKKPILCNDSDKWNKYENRQNQPNSQHVIGIFNWLQDQTLEKGADYFMMHMADVVIPPDTIHVLLKSFKRVPNAGWIGGVLHHKFPYQRELQGKDPMKFGLLGPWVKITENMKSDWGHKNDGYDVCQPSEKEILKWQEEGLDILTNAVSTGHCWMVPPEILKRKIHMAIHKSEASFVFAEKLWEMGYNMCCNTRLYFEHISLDGKIYRHGYNEELTIEEKAYIDNLFGFSSSKEVCLKMLREIALEYREMVIKKYKPKAISQKRNEAKPKPEVVESQKEKPPSKIRVKPKEKSVEVIEVKKIEKKVESKKEVIQSPVVTKSAEVEMAKQKIEDETELFEEYKAFVTHYLKYGLIIPPRPKRQKILVFDDIHHRNLNQKEWDELYGKWSEFIKKKKQ